MRKSFNATEWNAYFEIHEIIMKKKINIKMKKNINFPKAD